MRRVFAAVSRPGRERQTAHFVPGAKYNTGQLCGRRNMMHTFRLEGLAVALFLLLLLALPAASWDGSWQGPEKGPQLNAQLADKEKNAARRIAVVEVDVRNVTLT